jgi:hypothetical protein
MAQFSTEVSDRQAYAVPRSLIDRGGVRPVSIRKSGHSTFRHCSVRSSDFSLEKSFRQMDKVRSIRRAVSLSIENKCDGALDEEK